MIAPSTRMVVAMVLVVAACSSSAAPEPTEVLIPAGPVIVGANCVGGNAEASCDSSPRNLRAQIHLDAFFVDRGLVDASDYQRCVDAGACADDQERLTDEQRGRMGATRLGRYNLAKAWVRRDDAARYCRWRNARLPTADEFERFARGTDGRVTPWSGGRSPCPADGSVTYACVTAKGPAGVRALAYNPQWVDADDKRYPAGMIRGGFVITFWTDNKDRSSYDEGWQPTLYAGFRCARSVGPAASAPQSTADAAAAPPRVP